MNVAVRRTRIALLFGWLLTASTGCRAPEPSAWEVLPITPRTIDSRTRIRRHALLTRADRAFRGRDDEKALREAIAALREALVLDPSDATRWVLLARALHFLGECHIGLLPARRDEVADTFEHAFHAAENALASSSRGFVRAMQKGHPFEHTLHHFQADAVPALYWRSVALGRWAALQGRAMLFSFESEIRASIERAVVLAPGYFHAGPHRFLGTYFAHAPSFAGKHLGRSRFHFDRAFEMAPDYFPTRVLFAREYAVATGDRKAFEEALGAVIAGDPDRIEGAGPENRCAQRSARELVLRADELFATER